VRVVKTALHLNSFDPWGDSYLPVIPTFCAAD
jgi:hypothetical protein